MVSNQVHVPKNMLLELDETFDYDGFLKPQTKTFLHKALIKPDFLTADQVYRKLSTEILQFRQDVKEILAEVHPIKQEIISQISKIISRSIPAVDIDVYGSHATQLCLHWSDIDLVVIPKPLQNNSGGFNNGSG